MQASSREKMEEHEKNVQDRQTDLEMLQDLIPVERQRDRLKNDEIPKLQKEIQEYDSELPSLTDAADKVHLKDPHSLSDNIPAHVVFCRLPMR